jgi:hypothetical protein
VSLSTPPLSDKLAELAETFRGRDIFSAEASALLTSLRQAYPDFEKVLARRFSRFSAAQQQVLIGVLQGAAGPESVPFFTQWSQNQELPIATRVRALTALEHLGHVAEPGTRDALLQAEQLLQHLQAEAPSPLTDDGQLLPAWHSAVLSLPQALALALVRELTPVRPLVALAVIRSLRSAVGAQEFVTLADSLAHIPVLDSVAELQDMLATTSDKTLHKAVKKALHRLKARGLMFDADPHQPHTVVLGSVTHRLEKCLASHVDPNGDRALWMIRTKAFGGYHLAYLIINYGTGIQMAMGLQATRRELPDLLEKAQAHVPLVEIDPPYAQALVQLAHQMNLETRTPVPEEYFAVRDIIGEPAAPFDQALIYSVLSAADLDEAQAYGDYASDLLTLPEFAGWTLPATVVQKYADQLREIEDSQIVVSSTLKQERMHEVRARALEEVLAARTRWLMRLRLEEMAYYLLRTDRRREALWAVAAARSLDTENPDRLRRNPFAGALLERSLEAAKARPGSRIIQPFARAADADESRRVII